MPDANRLTSVELYDLRTRKITEDLPFIAELASRSGRNILELACGTGRIISTLPSDDFELWGIDICEEALNIARAKTPHVRLFNMDVRKLCLPKKFNLALLAFNSLEQLHSIDDQKLLLQQTKKHLASNGKLYIHTTPLDIATFTPTTGPKMIGSLFDHYGREIKVEFSARRDLKTRISDILFRYFYFGDTSSHAIEDRFQVKPLTSAEAMLLLEVSGFEIENIFGDFDKNRFKEGESSTLIIVARAIL